MNTIIESIKIFKNPAVIIATLSAMAVGAFLGVLAFYNGWLG